MKTSNRFSTTLFVALVVGLFTAHQLRAGEITPIMTPHSGIASIAATTVPAAMAINNDDVAGLSPNEVFVTQKNYVGIGPVDLVFGVVNSGGVTEYHIKEGVANSTGLPWVGYHIELGFGFGTGFVKSLPGDGLDFDSPDFNSPTSFNPPFPGTFFATVAEFEDDIIATGGVMPTGSFAGYFHFNVDVPDGISEFTIRQSPIGVPEPGKWAVASLALLGLAIYRRR